jgi:lysophospholipase L1-like esterase
VTVGAQASDAAHRYQDQFAARLRRRFPKADVELSTVAWGGRNTGSFLAEPPGSQYNFAEKVLGAKPDLIVMEFVNDSSLTPEQIEERYSGLLARFREIRAEWIILTPHFVWGEWMGTGGAKVTRDPRPYVAGLKQFTAKHNVALADASRHWERLAAQGIPYQTLLSNSLNHPDDRGHKLFADALMELFGE